MLQDETADRWLKRILLGAVWQTAGPVNDNDLNELLNWLTTHANRTFHSLETQLIHDQFQLWTINCKERKELFKWLGNAPFERAEYLIWEQMLSRFPENRIAEWLQYNDIWFNLNLLPNRKQLLPEMNLQVQFPEPVTKFIHAFLEEKWQNAPQEALQFISGRLEVEKRVLSEQLRSQLYNGIPIEQDVYDLLADLKNFPQVIELARQLLPAETPSPITERSSVADIQLWLRDEYLPFYNSSALLNRVELTEPYVAQFEKWLQDNYSSLLINGQGMAYRQIALMQERLADGPVLIAVMDGLDYLSAQNDLLPVLQTHGIYPQGELTPCLSFIPTETFIAKPALVCGWMNSQISPEIPKASYYKNLLKNSLHLSDDEIISATDQELSLFEIVQKSYKVYLYLDNQLDREYLHAGLSPYVRCEKYRGHLKKQAENLAEAVQSVQDMFNKTLTVAVCSDHGYTVLPENSSVINIASGSNVKTRSMYSDKAELPEDFDEDMIWRLNPGLFGLSREMAIPHGYTCFTKRPKGATHGGCSPQELAVPWFILSTHKTEPLWPLVFTIEGVIFRKRKENPLTLTISHPNNLSISITELNISGVNITALFPIFIEKNSFNKLAASFNASAVNDNVVEFEISYRFGNKVSEMKNSVSLKVKTTGAMSTEFDDDFEF